jgi:hypothetical protein
MALIQREKDGAEAGVTHSRMLSWVITYLKHGILFSNEKRNRKRMDGTLSDLYVEW